MFKWHIKDLLPHKLKNIIKRILFGQPNDEISYILRYFKDITGASFIMIDVGAHYGSSLITFAKKKWAIYAFEPNQENRKVLLKRTKNYRNIHVDYKVIISEWFPVVQYGKRHNWKAFSLNANEVINESAWGNIIAVKKENFENLKAVIVKSKTIKK